MQLPVSPATLVTLALVPLVAWRVYVRVRRMFGRQRLSKWRARITLTFFPLLVLMLAAASAARPELLLALAVALAAGGALSVYGIRKTHFEAVPGMLYYTPHSHLGVVLSLLFLTRIAYRLVEVGIARTDGAAGADFARSPLTLAVFGLLAGYYIGYAIGLLRWRRGVLRAKAEREARAAAADQPEGARTRSASTERSAAEASDTTQ